MPGSSPPLDVAPSCPENLSNALNYKKLSELTVPLSENDWRLLICYCVAVLVNSRRDASLAYAVLFWDYHEERLTE